MHHVLTFPLDGLPNHINQDCQIVLSFPNGLRLERLRRFQRAAPMPPNSTALAVQVDHARRSIRIDGRLFHGVGFYTVYGVGANGVYWGYDDVQELALKGLRGTTQVMIYSAFDRYLSQALIQRLLVPA